MVCTYIYFIWSGFGTNVQKMWHDFSEKLFNVIVLRRGQESIPVSALQYKP